MPPRYRSVLSKKFNVCEKYIDCIFRGERMRVDIIDEAIKMAEEHRSHLQAQTEKIREL